MFTLCHGINKLRDAIISLIQQTQIYLNQISQGKILKEISGNYQGDSLSIKQSLEQSVSSINLLISDSKYLVESALQGQLSNRAQENAHKGEFKLIIQGINQTLDAIIKPVQLTSSYLDCLAIGELPNVDSQHFEGDFKKIETSLRTSINAIEQMILDTSMLADAANIGELTRKANAENHKVAYKDIVLSIMTHWMLFQHRYNLVSK